MLLEIDEDRLLQFRNTTKVSPTDHVVGDFCKEALDLIEPRTVGGNEMDVPTWMPSQPLTNPFCLVGSVVIHDDVQIELGGRFTLEVAKEFK